MQNTQPKLETSTFDLVCRIPFTGYFIFKQRERFSLVLFRKAFDPALTPPFRWEKV